MSEIWIPKAVKRKSALRKQLHMPEGQPISVGTLQQIKDKEKGEHVYSHGKSIIVTRQLKKRATLAMTLKKMQKKRNM